MISGYGIYHSCRKLETGREAVWLSFMKKRMNRIGPEYYLYIFFSVLCGAGAFMLSTDRMKELAAHLTFMQTFYPRSFTTINGAFWTLSIIFQFYLVAVPMYYCLGRVKHLFPICFIILTLGYKAIVLGSGIVDLSAHGRNFYWSRQTLAAVIDNFAVGMYAAKLRETAKRKPGRFVSGAGITAALVLMTLLVTWGILNNVHNYSFSGVIWHKLAAALFACILVLIPDAEGRGHIYRFIALISENEYGIYIIHLPLIIALHEQAGLISCIQRFSILLVYFVVLCIVLVMGVLYSRIVFCIRQRFMSRRNDCIDK